MKIVRLFMMLFVVAPAMMAQPSEQKPIASGSVVYVEKFPLNIPDIQGLPKEILDQIPKENVARKILLFNDSVSLYRNDNVAAKAEQPAENESGNVSIKISSSNGNDVLFTNLNKKEITETKEFFGKTFLIRRSAEAADGWKIMSEQKEILGFPCQKAVTEKDSTLTEAWFTPLIPVSGGPQGYGGLPGLILQLRVKSAKRDLQINAASVSSEIPDMSQLVAPKDGKPVSEKQFEKIVTDKTKEMQQEFGGGSSNVFIKVQR